MENAIIDRWTVRIVVANRRPIEYAFLLSSSNRGNQWDVRRNFLKSCGQKLEGKNSTSKGLNMHGFAISRNGEGGKFDGV